MDDSKESLDPKVASAVLKEVERAIQRRSDAILAGFYSQFPDLTRKTLEHIQELVPYPKKETREWIIRKLLEKYPKVYTNEKVAAKAFASAWDLSKKRALEINGRSLHLMSIFDRRYYTGNLQRILKAFESSTDRHAVKEDASLKSASGSRD
jgi:hypothetical protein